MSARQKGIYSRHDFKIYEFEQKIPIPTYLIALAVGDIHYRQLGNRVGVISEPSQLDKAAKCL